MRVDEREVQEGGYVDFPGDPEVDSVLPLQEARTGSLVRKLRYHMLHSVVKKNFLLKREAIYTHTLRADSLLCYGRN